MASLIGDYGLIGDLQTAGLVSRRGCLDWLCFPRFDSGACFAALLGTAENGHWTLQPAGEFRASARRYRDHSLVLETEFECEDGSARLIDFMPVRSVAPKVVRIVEGIRGSMRMRMDLVIRFDYGRIVPWVRRIDGTRIAVSGPNALRIDTPVEAVGRDLHTIAEFTVREGQRLPFSLTWFPSHEALPAPIDAEDALACTDRFWSDWAGKCTHVGPWHEAVLRSLIVLKALTYAPTGGIIAAPTTSLPECLGGVRNWDYRFCWLRDATLTLLSFLRAGYVDEAQAWRDWFLRAIAGSPDALQVAYGVAGERWLPELALDWLPGYEDSRPVRIGNAAHGQRQLDVYGEIADALFQARSAGIPPSGYVASLGEKLLEFLADGWRQPDHSIWEVRGPPRCFTHSKVMAWVAFDRAVKSCERFGRPGPIDRWRALREEIHSEVCREGYNQTRNTFVRYYGSERVDASLLMIPLVGFLPADDPRVAGTIAAVQRELMPSGLVERYLADEENSRVDGLPPGEGAFLPCSFWLVEALAMQGRQAEATQLFERLLGLRNDLGLIAEEYDVANSRLVGNFPQAFTHLALVDAAYNLIERQPSRET